MNLLPHSLLHILPSLPHGSATLLLCQLCELKEHGWLSDEEEAAVDYLHLLEQVYPVTFVDVDRGGGTERRGRRWVGGE